MSAARHRNSGGALLLLTIMTAVLTLVLGTIVFYCESGTFKVGHGRGTQTGYGHCLTLPYPECAYT